jgi:SAM-dependent methyltransferase
MRSRFSTSEAYGAFAFAYDPALGERFFSAIEPLLGSILRDIPAGARHLDVACGSGLAARWFQDRGFRSLGLDASLPMLGIARSRVERLVAADMRAMPFRAAFEVASSFYDSLNHLLSRRDLATTFGEVARCLAPGGTFLFDVNHPGIYPKVWGAIDPYESSAADHHLAIHTRWLAATRRGDARVQGWAKTARGLIRIDERRRQRAWTERELRAALDREGLEVDQVIPFDPFDEGGETPVKLVFVARRRRG